MKKIIYILLLISVSCFSQTNKIVTYNGKIVTYNGKIVTYEYFNPLAKSLFIRMFPEPTTERKEWISEAFDSLEYYYQDSIIAMWMLAADNVDNSLLDWYSDTLDATAINNPYFAQDTGWLSITAGYLDMNYNPSSDIRFKQDTISMHVYSHTNNFDNAALLGCSDGNKVEITAVSNLSLRGRMNISTGSIDVFTSNITGLISLSRIGANQYLFRNGIQIDTEVDASTGVPNANIHLLNVTFGVASTNIIQFYCIGIIRDPLKLFEIIERYIDHLGTGVIN